MKDWRGQDIYVGSAVVWPTRVGSDMYMHEGNVTGLDPLVVRNKNGKLVYGISKWRITGLSQHFIFYSSMEALK